MDEKAAPVKAATSTSASNDKNMAMIATLPVVGLIMFYAMKDASPLVKHYAKQSNAILALWLVGVVIAVIPFIGWMISMLLGLVEIAVWVILLIKASSGEMYKLPVIGEFLDGLLK